MGLIVALIAVVAIAVALVCIAALLDERQQRSVPPSDPETARARDRALRIGLGCLLFLAFGIGACFVYFQFFFKLY